jgi:cell division protein FtsI (penicillin-binding protein 3)/stage V sporulation protein D (sporulation-specific penicillin-binding protein)
MKHWRIYFVFLFVTLAGLGITVRIFYIQIVKNGYYSALARGQHVDYAEYVPPRGNIFFQDKFNEDDSLHLAATNKDWPLLYAVPKEIDDPVFAASAVASVLYEGERHLVPSEEGAFSLGEKNIYERIKDRDDPYEPIARKVENNKVDAINALKLKGIYTKAENLRNYPQGDLAAHALGFVGYRGNERVGQYGAEGFYDEYLARGDDLILSMDYNIQFMLERILKEAKDKLSAESASAIIIDPKNGEVLALAAVDSFDPNNYSQVDNIDIFLNDAVQKIFEPGSIFKPFTAAAALNEGAISPNTEYEDRGYVKIGAYTIRNAKERKYGVQNMTSVLDLSINTGAVFMESAIGHDKFRDYIKQFGFGVRTGVDLQGEVAGDIENLLKTSRDINFATASFGQGIAITPIQLVAAFSAFANGGKMVRPHVVREIVEGNKTRRQVSPQALGSPISHKTAAQITSMLVSVVDNGYGKKAGVKGYKIAGKTGTAQVAKEDGRGYQEDKTIHSFVGYAPAYDPKFLALIKVDNPRGINFSSDSVAPLFSKIAEYILNYYEIPPDVERLQ